MNQAQWSSELALKLPDSSPYLAVAQENIQNQEAPLVIWTQFLLKNAYRVTTKFEGTAPLASVSYAPMPWCTVITGYWISNHNC